MAFAEQLVVRFSTVNRWENEKAVPNRLATKAIKTLGEEWNVSYGLIEMLEKN